MIGALIVADDKKIHGGKRNNSGAPRKIDTEFAKWAKASGYTTGPKLAAALDVSVPFAYKLLAESRRPGLDVAHRIEKLSDGKFPTEYWLKIQADPTA